MSSTFWDQISSLLKTLSSSAFDPRLILPLVARSVRECVVVSLARLPAFRWGIHWSSLFSRVLVP